MTDPYIIPIGRYTLALRLDADRPGRVVESWAPRAPVRLTPAELQGWRQARAAFSAACGLELDEPPARDRRRAEKRAAVVAEQADEKAAATSAWSKATR